MADNSESINQLLEQIELLVKKQNAFSREIYALKSEVIRLKEQETETSKGESDAKVAEASEVIVPSKTSTPARRPVKPRPVKKTSAKTSGTFRNYLDGDFDLEKFIGENLINKIGIVVTIIGVAIGAKYAIDNDLITPEMRIVLGYAAGFVLLGIGLKLRKKYTNYSAVLVSGAMAISYFITYFAYGFYDLIPKLPAFALMVAITVLTVGIAIFYNKQIIAHIGLVGAYAVPYILGGDPDQVFTLFSYVAIINLGILFIAFRKNWKPLYYFAFLLTWMIYATWYFPAYKQVDHFEFGLVFIGIFFVTFYLTFLAYKLIQKEPFSMVDVIMLIGNSFIFYGLGYDILQGHDSGSNLLGMFTLGNAVLHFLVSLVVYKKELGDRNVFFLVSSLVIAFLTIAIPVELDGHWVTLLWTALAALLFWVGRTNGFAVYEFISYALMVLAFFSLMHDWATVYEPSNNIWADGDLKPVFNIYFLTSLLFAGAFAFVNHVHRDNSFTPPVSNKNGVLSILSIIFIFLFVFVAYASVLLEIRTYFDQLYSSSKITLTPEGVDFAQTRYDEDLNHFKNIWSINYSLLFLAVFTFLNIKKWKNPSWGQINYILNFAIILIFLAGGLYAISELRVSYLEQTLADYYERGTWNIWIRYVSFLFIGLMLWLNDIHERQDFSQYNFIRFNNLLIHLAVLWIASSELIHWMDMSGAAETYKLGLSILWGVYALLLIVLGIWKKQTYLRVSGIVLFGITLVKLFFYDIEHLETIPKTIVFVSLGTLLLIISFLYNKYKEDIFGGD
jgi:uncharacterized membrane protein